jgi:hypothetical protein
MEAGLLLAKTGVSGVNAQRRRRRAKALGISTTGWASGDVPILAQENSNLLLDSC